MFSAENAYFMVAVLIRSRGDDGGHTTLILRQQLVLILVSRMMESEMNSSAIFGYDGFMRVVGGYKKERQCMGAFHPHKEICQYANGRF